MALKDITITGSIGTYPTLSYGQKMYISSTDEESFPIEQITGSSAGAWPNFNGEVTTNNLFVNVTQSWSGSINTEVGIVDFIHDTEEEFINGEFSGSILEVTNQRLIDEDCVQFLTVNTTLVNYKPYFYNYNTSSLGDFLNFNTSPNAGEIYLFYNVLPSIFIPNPHINVQ